MNIVLKILLGLAGVVLALFILVTLAVTVIFEPDDFRPWIVDAVEDATGRPFALEGELELDVFPCCSVALGPSRLGNPQGFPEDDFARIEAASLSLELWPLLVRQEVEIGTVTLTGMQLNLLMLADGRANWEFDTEEPAPAAEDDAASTTALSIDGLLLRDGRIAYRDEQAGQSYRVTDLQLETGALSYGAAGAAGAEEMAFPLEGAFTVTDDSDGTAAEVRLSAQVAVAGDELTVNSPNLQVSALGPAIPGNEAALTLRADRLIAALGEQTGVTLHELGAELSVAGTRTNLSGTAALENFDDSAIRFDLVMDQLDVDALAPPSEEAQPEPLAADAEPTTIPLDALAELDLDGKLRIDTLRAAGLELAGLNLALSSANGDLSTRLSARAGSGSLQLEGSGRAAGAEPFLAGTLNVDGVSPRDLLAAMDALPATADPEVLRLLAGEARWRLTPQRLALTDMRWQLDDTEATGSLHLDDFDTLAARFDLALGRMNLDAYLPAEEAEAAEAEAETELPVEALRDLRLDGRLRAEELVLMSLTLRDLAAELKAADGVLRIDPMRAGVYGGEYRGSVVVDATGPAAKITLDQQIDSVQIAELLKTLFDTEVLAGAMSLKVAGSGTGNTTTELLRGLAADVSADLSEGVYRGMDLQYEVQRAQALLNKEAPPAAPASKETPLRALAFTGRMVDGVLRTDGLTAETPVLRIGGTGGVNLLDLALDYQLDAQVLEGVEGRLGKLANTTIPLTVNGPLTSPRVGVDLKGLLTTTVRDTVEEKARRALLKRLGGDDEDAGAGGAGSAEAGANAEAEAEAPAEAEEEEKPSTKDLFKRGLRDLLKPKPEAEQEPGDSPG